MKFKKGDRVCAVLVCNKWGVDFLCYVGELDKIEKRPNSNPVAQIKVDTRYSIVTKTKHEPVVSRVDAKLFKILLWTPEVKAQIKEVRSQSRILNEATLKLKEL